MRALIIIVGNLEEDSSPCGWRTVSCLHKSIKTLGVDTRVRAYERDIDALFMQAVIVILLLYIIIYVRVCTQVYCWLWLKCSYNVRSLRFNFKVFLIPGSDDYDHDYIIVI